MWIESFGFCQDDDKGKGKKSAGKKGKDKKEKKDKKGKKGKGKDKGEEVRFHITDRSYLTYSAI